MLKFFLLITLLSIYTNCQVYTEQYLYVDDNSFQNTVTGCTKYRYTLNYKPTHISIMNITGIDSIFYSDENFYADCGYPLSTVEEKCASEDGLICAGSMVTTMDTYQINMGYCVDKFYIYIKPTAGASISSFHITAKYYSGQCAAIDPETDPYVECGSISTNECQTTCDYSCSYYNCVAMDPVSGINQTYTSLCLPAAATAEEIFNRCSNFTGVNAVTVVNDCSPVWQKYAPNISDEDFESPLFYVIVISIGLVLISVIFYRYKLAKTGEAPFAVPGWCPGCLYPKQEAPSQELVY